MIDQLKIIFLLKPPSHHLTKTFSTVASWSNLSRTFWMLITLVACCGNPGAGLAGQSPIYITFDLHVDPVNNNIPLSAKHDVYQERTDNIVWVLDQTESLDVPISFLSGGWYMEMLVAGGPSGEGAQVLRELYSRGGQIGSHSHNEFQSGPFNWPSYSGIPTLEESRTSWQDNIDWVNEGITTAFWGNPPVPVEEINNIKGAHLPKTETDFHTLMEEFGMEVREPGPEEDYYGYYGHHIWNPYRPSTDNLMSEDLSAPFVQVVSGPVIGKAGIHHGTLQDMTAESIKRQFLQLYINWRYAERTGAAEKVWTWGWGGHAHDFSTGSDSRTDLLDVLDWLEDNFGNRVAPSGTQAMEYLTHVQTADIYELWEADHPTESSFSFDSLTVDWDEYPYLAPVAVSMKGFLWEADLDLSMQVDAFQLTNSGDDAVVAWREIDSELIDLSSVFSTTVGVLGLETGDVYALSIDPATILVREEPFFIAPQLPGLSPGTGPQILSIHTNYSQLAEATLEIEVTGTGAGPGGHDQLVVSGNASLDGTLAIETDAGFTPAVGATPGTIGDQFVILTANSVTDTFSTIQGKHLGQGKFYLPMYHATNVTLGVFQSVAGDTDGNRVVDITDFNTLTNHWDPHGNHATTNNWTVADFDFDRDIDITDFNLLASNFDPTGYVSKTTMVPTPSTGLLLCVGCFFLCLQGRSQK